LRGLPWGDCNTYRYNWSKQYHPIPRRTISANFIKIGSSLQKLTEPDWLVKMWLGYIFQWVHTPKLVKISENISPFVFWDGSKKIDKKIKLKMGKNRKNKKSWKNYLSWKPVRKYYFCILFYSLRLAVVIFQLHLCISRLWKIYLKADRNKNS